MNNKTYKRWTKEETEYLRTHINLMTYEQIAEKLGRTKGSISLRVHKLQLSRSEEGIRFVNRNNSGRFQKGSKPWNKGKKTITKGRMAETQFKKGGLPANTLYDDAITIRKASNGKRYKFIRLAKGKWDLLHREVWRREHGEIPEGHVVSIKGDPLLVELGKTDNLELISRKQNLKRNYPSNRAELQKKIVRSRKINNLKREALQIEVEVRKEDKSKLDDLSKEVIKLRHELNKLKEAKAKQLRKEHQEALKKVRADEIRKAFEDAGLSTRGVSEYVNAYINKGERKIAYIINLKREQIAKKRIEKAKARLAKKTKAPTFKPSQEAPKRKFEYNPSLPGTRQDQLLAWQRETFGQVKYISKKFHLAKS